MSSLYSTPCKPSECDKYTIDGCKVKCERYAKFQELQHRIRTEKQGLWDAKGIKSAGVDDVFKHAKGNKQRVGQR